MSQLTQLIDDNQNIYIAIAFAIAIVVIINQYLVDNS